MMHREDASSCIMMIIVAEGDAQLALSIAAFVVCVCLAVVLARDLYRQDAPLTPRAIFRFMERLV